MSATRQLLRAAVVGIAVTACAGGGVSSAPPQATSTVGPPATTATSTTPPSAAPPSAPPPGARPTSPATARTPPPVVASTATGANDVVARTMQAMTLEQRVGQLFMVGGPATAVGRATRSAITTYHVGNVMLTGRSTAGAAATAQVSAGVRARATRAATAGVPLLVATDQEGGAVQVLRGNGFTRIPSGLTQGGWSTARLRVQAARWGRELRAAGIDVDLAPVADTVPSATAARTNAPIGRFEREFGFTPSIVGAHSVAFDQGMAQAGVATTVKHFPGLGRVTGNTDVSRGVTDRTTTRTDAYLEPFARAVDAGAPFVMMSTAYYARIDPHRPAAFSSLVIERVLRGDLGFTGVVISDDLGNAAQVAAWSPGSRAVRFVAAGGDLVLTVDPTVLPAMYGAVLARARTDAAFRSRVEASVQRVLRVKVRQGLRVGR